MGTYVYTGRNKLWCVAIEWVRFSKSVFEHYATVRQLYMCKSDGKTRGLVRDLMFVCVCLCVCCTEEFSHTNTEGAVPTPSTRTDYISSICSQGCYGFEPERASECVGCFTEFQLHNKTHTCPPTLTHTAYAKTKTHNTFQTRFTSLGRIYLSTHTRVCLKDQQNHSVLTWNGWRWA